MALTWKEIKKGYWTATTVAKPSTAMQALWDFIICRVLPANEGVHWDYLRIEIWPDSGRLIAFPASTNSYTRIEKAACQIEISELQSLHDRLADESDNDELLTSLLRHTSKEWASQVLASAQDAEFSGHIIVFDADGEELGELNPPARGQGASDTGVDVGANVVKCREQFPWSVLKHDLSQAGPVFPPHQTMGIGYDYEAADSVSRIPHDKLLARQPDLGLVVLERRARLLDLMDSSVFRYGMLVSERFASLLAQFRLPPHRAYQVPASQDDEQIPGYVWLHIPQPILDLTGSEAIGDVEKRISSISQLKVADLVPIYRPVRFQGRYVSARLRAAIEAAGITGVRFGSSKLFRRPLNTE